MIRQEVWMDVKQLHAQGASIRRIARMTGLSRVTVRRILSRPVPKPYGPRPPRPRKIDSFTQYLERELGSRPLARATRLYEEISTQGYTGHYEGVKRWVRERRREEAARRRACVRFETGPGVEAQFDWKGPLRGRIACEPQREVWIFRFTLGYSRKRWSRVVTSLELPAVLWSLRERFEALGGVPHRLVFDNFRAAVVRPRPALQFQPFFLDFCRHYGVEPWPAWRYSPERKGKVERGFLDLVWAELLEQTYPTLESFQAALDRDDTLHGRRVVSTTGARPDERLERERPFLLPLPDTAFDPRLPQTRRVLSECTISFHGAYYSVPYALVGSRVTVKADPWGQRLEIFHGAERVAEHRIVAKGERSIVDEHIAALRRPRRERAEARQPAPRRPVAEALPALLSLVRWPAVEVPRRPIEEYLRVEAGGAW